ncbi:MAG: hypothetical protein PHN39_01110 [Candidatus Pacebacteria bacterium]|nr:hypothetical protein [Candidatus Paceibacterota bacterium]
MDNPFLHNDALIRFIQACGLDEEGKQFLISKVPQLDDEERISLFETLKEVFLLDMEQKESLERLNQYLHS